MTLEQITRQVLQTVEELTGKPVVVQADPTLRTLAFIKMARGSAPLHVLAYNPSLGGSADYAICCQAGFAIRVFQVATLDRFDIAAQSCGRKEVRKLIADHATRKKLPWPKDIFPQLGDRLFDGLIRQLRSMPISLRVDAWIRREYPELDSQQREVIARQLNENATSLRPDVREMVPTRIQQANVAMNAAFAAFWSRAWGDPLSIVPYKSSGDLAAGEALLKLFDEIPDDPNNDRRLIETWGSSLNLDGWYQFVPYA